MLGAVFKIMWLRLWRDKGALILAFILPGFIFAIFAAIFSNASGGDLDLRAALAVTSTAPASQGFADRLKDVESFTISTNENWSLSDVRERVRLGQDDAGIVIAGDLSDTSSPAIIIVSEPSREVAATVLKGQIRQILSETQTEAPVLFTEVAALNTETANGPSDQSVTYYIGATAILFLLFSAMQGASLSLEERGNGISDRLLVGPMGALGMLTGKFLFLVLIGFIQAALIIAVAHVFFKVEVVSHLPALALACVAMASLAASIGLLTASLCKSTAQMHTVSTFVVLLFSAVGGSMVPRFMMPDWLQAFAKFTPNNYAIDAIYGILARGQSVADLVGVWGVLFGGAAVCLCLAAFISHLLGRV